MRLFYCPVCKRQKIAYPTPTKSLDDNLTVWNMRDGFGRSILHYKCECGNYLAGSIDVSGVNDVELIDYYKTIIEEYNVGGDFYEDGFLEQAIQSFINRRKNELKCLLEKESNNLLDSTSFELLLQRKDELRQKINEAEQDYEKIKRNIA